MISEFLISPQIQKFKEITKSISIKLTIIFITKQIILCKYAEERNAMTQKQKTLSFLKEYPEIMTIAEVAHALRLRI